jgi:AcrR family transcriptional regulator
MTTKDKILKSALKLFTKQGIDKTSTQQISDDVGIASGTLFVHFKTKQELIDAIYLSIKKKSFDSLIEAFNPDAPAEVGVKTIARHFINYYLKHYREFLYLGLVEIDPQISKEALAASKEEYAAATQIIKRWIQSGYLKDVDVALLHDVTWSSISAIVRYCKANKMKKVDESYLDIVWEAVKK